MIDFTRYHIPTGRILSTGSCSTNAISMQVQGDDDGVIVGEQIDAAIWYLPGGVKTMRPGEALAVDLENEKPRSLGSIDRSAEAIRGLFITNTASQPSIYLEKEKEALSVAAGDIDPTPNIDLEATRTGQTRLNVATAIIAKAAAWRQISAIIEDRRLRAKDAVREASSLDELRDAVAIDWSDLEEIAPPR